MKLSFPWWLKLEWRNRKVTYWLCAVEFPFTVAVLALFGIADPNTYRTALWTEGAKHGWNSDPILILYAYANYRPVAVPAPWSQTITTFNVVICVLSMFVLLAKTVMYITHVLPPFFSALAHAILATLYAYSISQQAGPDYLDPERPARFPWYLTRSCGAPVDPSLTGYCQQQKAAFAMTICMCFLFAVHTIVAIIFAFPSQAQKESYEEESAADRWMNEKDDGDSADVDYELTEVHEQPKSPNGGMFHHQSPMTPRTLAFQTLDGQMGPRRQQQQQSSTVMNKDLPLRHHISMGDETFKTGSFRFS